MVKQPKVKDLMDVRVPALRPGADILDAVDFLLQHRVSGAPVVDDDQRLIGILSEKDCLRLLSLGQDHDVPRGKVADYMSRQVVTVTPEMNVYFVAGMFLSNSFRRFPVVSEGRLIGTITRFDILRAIQQNLR